MDEDGEWEKDNIFEPPIIMTQDQAESFFSEWVEWRRIGSEWSQYPNWRTNIDERENYRESKVYFNCAETLRVLLQNSVDASGERWWPKLYPEAAERF